MENLKSTSIFMAPETHRRLKSLAALHGVRIGDALEGLLLLSETAPPAVVAKAMTLACGQSGELVPDDTDMAAYVEQTRALGAVGGEQF